MENNKLSYISFFTVITLKRANSYIYILFIGMVYEGSELLKKSFGYHLSEKSANSDNYFDYGMEIDNFWKSKYNNKHTYTHTFKTR